MNWRNKKGNLEYCHQQNAFHFNDGSKELPAKGWDIISDNEEYDITFKFVQEVEKPRTFFDYSGSHNEALRKLKKAFLLFKKAYLYDKIAN
jgi:hypothetical protein